MKLSKAPYSQTLSSLSHYLAKSGSVLVSLGVLIGGEPYPI